jgi:hypothetical protein
MIAVHNHVVGIIKRLAVAEAQIVLAKFFLPKG